MKKKEKQIKTRCHAEKLLLSISRFLSCCCFTKTTNNKKEGGPEKLHLRTTTLFNNGFTLIELLVVVLIIGILAAIALPQYQKAVLRARFVQAKIAGRTLVNAEELYYINNGSYTADYSALGVDLPGITSDISSCTDTATSCTLEFDWGRCTIGSDRVSCFVPKNKEVMAYMSFFLYSHYKGKIYCVGFGTQGENICKSDTGNPTKSTNWTSDNYGVYEYL
ncbi:MAG: prepilin-type N-terminal cleavage/methylation domain-containing protein [Elusimicrobiaceae bacterium]|nr:prepilin-type N-terminal cleavage/methylation domain-containing protein [Elusimicrobiaceae bacterium]